MGHSLKVFVCKKKSLVPGGYLTVSGGYLMVPGGYLMAPGGYPYKGVLLSCSRQLKSEMEQTAIGEQRDLR